MSRVVVLLYRELLSANVRVMHAAVAIDIIVSRARGYVVSLFSTYNIMIYVYNRV